MDYDLDLELDNISDKVLVLPKGSIVEGYIDKVSVEGDISEKGNPWIRMDFTVKSTDSDVLEKLQRENSVNFFYRLFISIEKDSFKVSQNNPNLGKLIKEFSLAEHQEDFKEGTEHLENPLEKLKQYFTNMGQHLLGTDCIAVLTVDNYDPDVPRNLVKTLKAA